MLDTSFPQPANLLNAGGDSALTPNNSANESAPLPMALFSSMLQFLMDSQTDTPPEPQLQEVLAAQEVQQTDQNESTQDPGALQLGALLLQMNWTQPREVIEPEAQPEPEPVEMPKAIQLNSAPVKASPVPMMEEQDRFLPELLSQDRVAAAQVQAQDLAEKVNPKEDLLEHKLSLPKEGVSAPTPTIAQKMNQKLKETLTKENMTPDRKHPLESVSLLSKTNPLTQWALHSPDAKINLATHHDKDSTTSPGASVLESFKIDSLVLPHSVPPHQSHPWLGEARETIKLSVDVPAAGLKESIQAQVFLEMPEKSMIHDSKEISSLNIRIYPPDLGEVNARLKMEKGSAHLIIQVENQQVKEIIQASLPQLREHFQRMDIPVSQMDVQNMENSAQNQQRQAERNAAESQARSSQLEGGADPQAEKAKVINVDALIDAYV